ncbi:uncharacterized protein LOC143857841 [Tasmannia lanceolata]|uniref:uncharacterized protein LOC143857841 n=1 Tax=Tasmannia lanceolata TaxID=3420 RepID=UPI004062F4A0
MSEIRPNPLYKQRSLSTDTYRDDAWRRRKSNNRPRRSKSVTDEDLDELRGCIELGFGFDSPIKDQRLSDTLPALDLYYAVHKQYYETVSKSASASESDVSPAESPHENIITAGDNPQLVKTKLRQWAQVVACSVRQCC